jgi:flagellar biogenesis protein FliO
MQGTTEGSANPVPWPQQPALLIFWRALKGLLEKARIQKKLRALRIEETLPLGEKRFLALVRWNGETLLVGVTPQNITLLQADTKARAALASGKEEPAA